MKQTITNKQKSPAFLPVAVRVAQLLSEAVLQHQNRHYASAEQLYQNILELEPLNFDAWHLYGVVMAQNGNPQLAAEMIAKAIGINPNVAEAHINYGNAMYALQNYAAALRSYQHAVGLKPADAQIFFKIGNTLQNLSRYEAALQSYADAIELQPAFPEAHNNLGNALKLLQRLPEATASYQRAIHARPDYWQAYHNLGLTWYESRNFQSALDCFHCALRLNPNFTDAWIDCGNVLQTLGRFDFALACFERAAALQPAYAEALFNCGAVLELMQQYPEALARYADALRLKPDYAEALIGQGNVLRSQKQYQAALASFEQAINAKPDSVLAHYNCGLTLKDMRLYEAALQRFDSTLAIEPGHAEAYHNRGNVLVELRRFDAALESYDRALELKPDYAFLAGLRLHTQLKICDWHDLEQRGAALTARIRAGEQVITPFAALALADSLAVHKAVAGQWSQAKYPFNPVLGTIPDYPRRDKIRIGYFSADFHSHPVAYLTAELFELHDRDRFEIVGFSFGPALADPMRERLKAAFDIFIDAAPLSDQAVAELARQLQVDIAVDLGGHTKAARTGVFAMRAAPLQISYLGYLGTMGADYMDYLLADRIIIPARLRPNYREMIVYLPSYQVNDSRRNLAEPKFSRAELGLPAEATVFCCFNHNYKFTPAVFAVWMRILKAVPDSVLLLYADNPEAAAHLSAAAANHGIGAERLVFGARLSMTDYLARYTQADLFLDTLPYNAGTTASDALWAGLPVLTCIGEAFPARVAASLLTAIGLPELIAGNAAEYEALAIALGNNRAKLAAIKQKLTDNRCKTPLFDTKKFTLHLEEAYTAMQRRRQAGLPPEHIFVKSAHQESKPCPSC